MNSSFINLNKIVIFLIPLEIEFAEMAAPLKPRISFPILKSESESKPRNCFNQFSFDTPPPYCSRYLIKYKNEKYPEIKNYISQLTKLNDSKEIKLVGKFFDEYFSEVKEHLNYEDEIAFTYFERLLSINFDASTERKFSVNDYSEHHSDIQYKLNDLKELLLNHIPIKNDRTVRRKIILSLYELQKHLNVHSSFEENIIVPSIAKLEKEIFDR